MQQERSVLRPGCDHKQHRAMMRGLTALCLTMLSCGGLAQDNFFNAVTVERPGTAGTGAPYSLFGWLNQKIGYGLEAPGAPFSRQERELNKVETSLFAQFDTAVNDSMSLRLSGKAYRDTIFSLNDNPQFSRDERNKFRSRFEVKDLYLDRQFDNGVYLKIGNQLFAWGLSEYSRITDLINTEDQFTFGQQDLEDIRLQVPATLVSFNLGEWTLDSVLTFQAGKNDTAPARDEFDQFLRLRDSGLTLVREQPDDQIEMFLRASTKWSRGDLQFMAGELNDNNLSVDRIEAIKSVSPRVMYSQNRMRALGVAGNWVSGSWLMFAELGLHADKAVRPTADAYFRQVGGWAQKDQVLSAFGIEYNGLRNMVLTFEVDNTHTSDHDEFMADARDQTSFGSRLYWTALNERFEFLAVWNELVDADTGIGRLSVNYNWSDRLDFGLLWMNYGSRRDSLFYDYRKNDILQLQLQFNFQI